MSTGRRLAKRSIIGTRVCAPGPDGLWYSGVIQDVKTPPIKGTHTENNNCINLTPDTRYTVRFDFKTSYTQSTIPSAIIHHNNQQGDEDTIMMDTTTRNIIHHSQQQHHPHHIQQLHHPQHQHIYHHIQSRPDIMLSPAQSVRRNALTKEFRESELIGPGFRSIMGVQLHPGQRVFLTYNGRETSGEVINHDLQRDEVIVKITPIGYEVSTMLKYKYKFIVYLFFIFFFN